MGEDALARFRGAPHRHRVPVVPAHPDHDGVGECRGAAGAGGRARRARAGARTSWRRSGSAERLTHYPAQLSGGEQQRVALARALAPRPSLLIADEPTGNLDEATGRGVIELLFALPRERGATLALVTHDPALASLCDRTLKMRSGLIEDAA